jgi:uncharacterized protein
MSDKKVQFVVKTSKHCNLRCRYCYEYTELHKQDVMTLDQIRSMYQHIESYYRQLGNPVEIHFIWHGGEPLLQSPDFYWQALDLQHEIFNLDLYLLRNTIQTNLTILDDARIQLLRDGFDSVGVSVDIFGGLRVYENGQPAQDRVFANIDRLTAAGIDFGCITVLNKFNLDRIPEIYDFYRTMNLSARLLPLHKTITDNQNTDFEISPYDTLKAYQQIFDLWLADDKFVWITPVIELVRQVIYRYSANAQTIFYDKREWEWINLINTSGDLYSYADAYNIERSHGNIFTTPLAQLVASSGHERAIVAAEHRLEQTCSGCKYFGACSGYPMAEDGYEYHELDEQGAIKCIVDRGMMHYIEYRLQEEGIIDLERMTINTKLLQMPAAESFSMMSYV